MKKVNRPHFICIGSIKSGTTWLYEHIKEHPEIWYPPIKQINYFDEIDRKVPTNIIARLFNKHWMNKMWRWRLKNRMYISYKSKSLKNWGWYFRYFFLSRSSRWYANLFRNKTNLLSGDITPDYCCVDEKIVQKIKKDFPDVKLILLLRDPIERMWSHIKMDYLKSNETIGNEINWEIKSIIEEHKHCGEYSVILNKWQKYFSEEQLLIAYYDQLKISPEVFMGKITDFLGVSKVDFHSDPSVIVNKGAEVSMPTPIYNYLKKIYRPEIEKLSELLNSDQFSNIWKKKHYI